MSIESLFVVAWSIKIISIGLENQDCKFKKLCAADQLECNKSKIIFDIKLAMQTLCTLNKYYKKTVYLMRVPI